MIKLSKSINYVFTGGKLVLLKLNIINSNALLYIPSTTTKRFLLLTPNDNGPEVGYPGLGCGIMDGGAP